MLGNQWYKKEKPLTTMIGMGGGATGLVQSAGSVGKFTIGGTEYSIADGYSSPVPTSTLAGSEFTMQVTAGPFQAVIKLWGAGGGAGFRGGCAGSGAYVTGTFEFLDGETYHWVAGGGGKRGREGAQPIGGGGSGWGPNNGSSGSGGGGGGYSGLFKAPAPAAPSWKSQVYAVLIAGGGGGAGQLGSYADPHAARAGGAGGAVYPPAAAPFGTNFGGGRGSNPNQTGPTTQIRGQYAEGPGNQGGGAPKSSAPYGGEGGGNYAQSGLALQGANYGSPSWPGDNGGGGGGGGGYWGGGSGGWPTAQQYGGGGGGGGFATVAPVHPEGIECTNVSGLIARHTGSPTPKATYANSSDPDWGGAGKGSQYAGGPGPGSANDTNSGGRCGRVVIKAP